MKKIGFFIVAGVLLSSCATASLNTQPSDFSELRTLIAKSKAAGAESCAPELQATAVANLHTAVADRYMGAHDHTGDHPHVHSKGYVHPPHKQTALVEEAKKAARDAYAKCSKTPAPVKRKVAPPVVKKPVSSVVQEVIALEGVYFENNSDKLISASVATLNSAVATLKKRSDVHVEVAAHTDSRGRGAYNLDLSNRRANSVMSYLVERGIDAKRLTARGYGETSPVADNRTAAGRAENRRVELRVR